jgi:hypothetical protein
MRTHILLLAAPLLAAASPPQTFSLQVVPDYPFTAKVPASRPPKPQAGPIYEPAPMPNPNVVAPTRAQQSTGTQISPSLFSRHDGYRGDSFTKGETAEADQNRRMLPSAGFTLKMPLDEGQPQ